ncbi:hypothetical protein Btru_060674 [Bulinus truncatus]|nr:hypothetical protein Btru_060674 [Bulinus truncatus]
MGYYWLFLLVTTFLTGLVCQTEGPTEAPYFDTQVREEIRDLIGEKVILPCKAFGTPRPYHVWYRNNTLIRSHGDPRFIVKPNSLEILHARREDSGRYSCHVSNQYGEKWLNLTLVIRNQTEMDQYLTNRDQIGIKTPRPVDKRPKGRAWIVLARSGTAWIVLARPGTARVVLARSGTAWIALARSGTAWIALARSGTAWIVLARSGTAWIVLAMSGTACRLYWCGQYELRLIAGAVRSKAHHPMGRQDATDSLQTRDGHLVYLLGVCSQRVSRADHYLVQGQQNFECLREEPKGQPFVKSIRRGRSKRTEIITKEIKDLEYFSLLGPITEIMNSKEYQKGNINYEKGKCEAVVPLYNLVTNSKITLVHEAIKRNPFKTEYFIWLDGGYGHGDQSLYPQDGVWIPRHLLRHPEKVTFIALRNLSDVQNLHKLDTALLAGGLFAGGTAAMETFYTLHKSVMNEYMTEWKIDDDQTTFTDCYFKQPSNFRPVMGSWYDLLKPFT